MKAKAAAYGALLFLAEILGSFWLWSRLRFGHLGQGWYLAFSHFEARRVYYWIIMLASGAILWIIAREISSNKTISNTNLQARYGSWILSIMLAVGLEVSTTALHWISPSSRSFRAFYHAFGYWGWDVTPLALVARWPTFLVYMLGHFIPWAAFLLVGLTLWHAWHAWKRRRNSPFSSPYNSLLVRTRVPTQGQF